jgi:hypothetical protein
MTLYEYKDIKDIMKSFLQSNSFAHVPKKPIRSECRTHEGLQTTGIITYDMIQNMEHLNWRDVSHTMAYDIQNLVWQHRNRTGRPVIDFEHISDYLSDREIDLDEVDTSQVKDTLAKMFVRLRGVTDPLKELAQNSADYLPLYWMRTNTINVPQSISFNRNNLKRT